LPLTKQSYSRVRRPRSSPAREDSLDCRYGGAYPSRTTFAP